MRRALCATSPLLAAALAVVACHTNVSHEPATQQGAAVRAQPPGSQVAAGIEAPQATASTGLAAGPSALSFMPVITPPFSEVFARMTAANVIVNDVLVNPGNSARVLLATDRSGVLASSDGAVSFMPSNRGFAHRQVASVLVDRNDSSTLYVGLLNDKEYGGVFVTRDAGRSWRQISDGLEGRDIFVLRQAHDGAVIAGTNRGIFQLDANGSHWLPLNAMAPADYPIGQTTAVGEQECRAVRRNDRCRGQSGPYRRRQLNKT